MSPWISSVSGGATSGATRAWNSSRTAMGSQVASIVGYQPLSSGQNAFIATLLASTDAARATFKPVSVEAPREIFNLPGLDRLVTSFKAVVAAEQDSPVQMSSTDWLLANNGLTPIDADAIAARVAEFVSQLDEVAASLADQATYEGNAAASAASNLRLSLMSAANSSYFLEGDVLDLTDPYAGRTVTPASIGVSTTADSIVLDTATWSNAYQATPLRAAETYNLMVAAIGSALQSFDPVVG